MIGIFIIVLIVLITALFIKKNKFAFFNKLFNKIKSSVDEDKQDKNIDCVSNEVGNTIAKELDDEDDIKKIFDDQDTVDDTEIKSCFDDDDSSELIIGNKQYVYMDIDIDNTKGQILIELRGDVVPKTCKNFYELCREKRYKNTKFHMIKKNFIVQGGDFVNGDGYGGESIYGPKFDDENFKLGHKIGCLAMANTGPNTNGCQFYIPIVETPELDGKSVVFGQVVKGMDIIFKMNGIQTDDDGRPFVDVVVTDCGIVE